MATTTKQTGLSIARDGNKFTFSWKLGQNYAWQEGTAWFGTPEGAELNPVGFDGGPWTLGGKVTSKALTYNPQFFYPYTEDKAVSLICYLNRCQGDPKGSYSVISPHLRKVFAFKTPKVPTVKAVPSDSLANTCTFTMNVTNDVKSNYMFTDIEWQSILVRESTESDGSKLKWTKTNEGWQTGTSTSASYSKTIAETLGTGSMTRWIRARSRGPAGASAWRYAKRVYAVPNAPVITNTTETRTASGHQILVNWKSASNNAYPVEENVLEYLVSVPDSNLQVPSGATFTDAITLKRTATNQSGVILYPSRLPEDNVFFVRVRSVHLLTDNESEPKIALYGNTAPPTFDDLETDDTTYRATITASNTSQIPDSFIVVTYRTASEPNRTSIVGVIPPGQSTITVQCPNWSQETGFAFGLYSAVGSYEEIQRVDGVTSFAVNEIMRSVGEVWDGGTVPQAPSTVTVTKANVPETVNITWDWTWSEATSSILSWSDHKDAWMSTDEPSEYEVKNISANSWNISGLDEGQKWYFRVRLKKTTGDSEVLGPWSDIYEIDLSSAPATPILTVSESVISEDGEVTCYWAYVSTDGTPQAFAEICEATVNSGVITYGDVIASTETAQHITIYADEVGWNSGETHFLCVRVTSRSGNNSDGWSDPVPVTIAEPIYSTITTTSLVSETIDGREVMSLKAMPLSATITGAGEGTTTLIIERAEDYQIERPDETSFNGYEGETIALYQQTGEEPIVITKDMLFGLLDDGARYRLIGIVQDGLGQSDETSIEFEVHWTNQAVMPEGTHTIQDDIAIIEPIKPSGWSEGDTCDIYRLSADRPELVYKGATFGERYVDPYPAIDGGYRLVYMTSDGDYITDDNLIAWLDLDGGLKTMNHIINFGDDVIELFYDTSQDNEWEKDFRETRYLGGSIQGDWNKPIGRSSSFDVSYVTVEDEEQIRLMRKLAVYPGLCHIRTRDGSSFDCDIQVSESRDYGGDVFRSQFALRISRVDSESPQGALYDDYFPEEG